MANGQYPYVFNNDSVDGSFGVTSPLVLDQLTSWGAFVNALELPNSSQTWATHGDQIVTSFSSKSEGALNLSTDGRYVTFVDYEAPVGTVGVSNSNTPGVIDSTNPVLYLTKGSGSNGVNTVYFVDTTGQACPTGGVGLPQPGATLPSASIPYDFSTVAGTGLNSNMCILKGFTTTLAKSATLFPFGIWFANPTTLYVADEGDGVNTYSAASGTYTDAAAQTTAGLQKWVFDQGTGSWELAYTLDNGLDLGQPYTVRGYPTGLESGPGGSGLPWAPATDGLRNITGQVNRNGTVNIWAVTSTVSGGGDQGADPNKLVEITDQLGATSAPAWEGFRTVLNAQSGRVVRGVSLTPATGTVTGQPSNGDGNGNGDGQQ